MTQKQTDAFDQIHTLIKENFETGVCLLKHDSTVSATSHPNFEEGINLILGALDKIAAREYTITEEVPEAPPAACDPAASQECQCSSTSKAPAKGKIFRKAKK